MQLRMCFDEIQRCQDYKFCWQLQCIHSGVVLFPVYNMWCFDVRCAAHLMWLWFSCTS